MACETIPSLQEAKVLEKLLRTTKTPAWISFSCKDERHINDGNLIEEVAALFINHPNVLAIGINCTAPNYVNSLIRRIKNAVPGKAIVVYPNSGETYNAKNKTWSGLNDPSQWVQSVIPWIESGATIIGGCCRIGPAHIKEIKELINEI